MKAKFSPKSICLRSTSLSGHLFRILDCCGEKRPPGVIKGQQTGPGWRWLVLKIGTYLGQELPSLSYFITTYTCELQCQHLC